jgi:hypothetical protein
LENEKTSRRKLDRPLRFALSRRQHTGIAFWWI